VDPGNGLLTHVLFIEASRSITIDGFAIHSRASALGGIGIGGNSLDVRLRNLTVDGAGVFGIIVIESSQVSLARVTARDPGYATVGVYDVSDVHIEDCLFEHSTGVAWHAGLGVGSGHVTMHGTTIRNMQVGMDIGASGSGDIVDYNTYYPLGGNTDVVIESLAAPISGAFRSEAADRKLEDVETKAVGLPVPFSRPNRERCPSVPREIFPVADGGPAALSRFHSEVR
jgi:hypothetical protein